MAFEHPTMLVLFPAYASRILFEVREVLGSSSIGDKFNFLELDVS